MYFFIFMEGSQIEYFDKRLFERKFIIILKNWRCNLGWPLFHFRYFIFSSQTHTVLVAVKCQMNKSLICFYDIPMVNCTMYIHNCIFKFQCNNRDKPNRVFIAVNKKCIFHIFISIKISFFPFLFRFFSSLTDVNEFRRTTFPFVTRQHRVGRDRRKPRDDGR